MEKAIFHGAGASGLTLPGLSAFLAVLILMPSPSKWIYRFILALVMVGVALFQTGCESEKPRTYRISKEERASSAQPSHPPAPPPSASAGEGALSGGLTILPGMAREAHATGGIAYSVPAGWEEFPAQGIRKANFSVTDEGGSAEVTVLAFAGDVGGPLANVNRWAGQLGLRPLSREGLAEVSEPRTISGHGGLWVRLEGADESILGALLPFHGFTWFFKMQGDTATLFRQETALKEFLDSIELEDQAHP